MTGSFSFQVLTQTIHVRGRKVISFAKCQVRDVVILSEERRVLKYPFESQSLIKKKRGGNDSFLFPSQQQFSSARSACLMKKSGTLCWK